MSGGFIGHIRSLDDFLDEAFDSLSSEVPKPVFFCSKSTGRHQAVIRPSSDRHLVVIWPSSGRHQAVIQPSSDSHQTAIRPSSGRPQAIIRPSSGRHETAIR